MKLSLTGLSDHPPEDGSQEPLTPQAVMDSIVGAMTMPDPVREPSPRTVVMAVLTHDAVARGDAAFVSAADELAVREVLESAWSRSTLAAASEKIGEAIGKLLAPRTGKPLLPFLL